MTRLAALIDTLANPPREAVADALGLAALCGLIGLGFAAAAIV